MEARTGIEDFPARPQPDGSDIRKVTEADLPRLVDALARAFYDDPMMGWIFQNDSSRRQRLLRGFDFYLRNIWLRHDECYATDQLSGGALWMPPDTWHLSVPEQLRMLPAMVRLTGRDFLRLFRVLNAMEAKHPHDRHYYLPVIGVAPEAQGRGFGSALLSPILDRCDKEGLPAYLEASSTRSRALYARNGFELVEEFRPAKGSPPLWRMWREPKR
jgi:GNAT superfamily N-acetyltransferase